VLRSIGVWRRECLARVELMFGKVSAWLWPFWLKSKRQQIHARVFSAHPPTPSRVINYPGSRVDKDK
jgi:hypothetical protein